MSAEMWLYSGYILGRIADESKDIKDREVKNHSNVFCP